MAILREGLGGPWPPRFLLGPLLSPPSFFVIPVQVHLVDIYSRLLSASNILNDNLVTL